MVPSRQQRLLICCSVMAGLVPAIHVVRRAEKDVDARDKPGHDDVETGEGKMPIVSCDGPGEVRRGRFSLSML